MSKCVQIILVSALLSVLFVESGAAEKSMADMTGHDHKGSQNKEQNDIELDPEAVVASSFVNKGVRVDFTVTPELSKEGGAASIREAEIAEVAFKISDATTGAPITPLEPAVWINLDKGSSATEGLTCRDKINLYLQGTLSFQADIDLNKFYMLIMNNDHTISVVDPILGVNGITQLYGMIILKEKGEDWVIDNDKKHLFVSMPKSGQVAVVDLETFKVIENIDVGSNPVRLSLQPDGRYVWVGNNGEEEEENGVTVIDTHHLATVGFIRTGPGHHEISHSDDSTYAFVTNSDSGTLSIIDSRQLEKVKELRVGERPISVAYSNMSRAAYVITEGDGRISIVDGDSLQVTERLTTEPGLITLRFDPGQRWGFAINLKKDRVYVLDASNNQISHTFPVGKQPHQVTFTETYAYIRNLGASEMQLIPLAQLAERKSFDLQTIPLGNRAPNEYPYLAVADAISATGEWDTVLVSSPADKTVYYYMEGMVAPMGTFPTYGRVPRAVQVVDRSLRETDKGIYSTKLRVPKSGTYEVAFLIDSPWVYNCFNFTADENPVVTAAREQAPPKIEILSQKRTITVGEKFSLKFALSRQGTDEPLTGIEDVAVLTSRPPGHWQDRQMATPLDDGSYEALFTVDKAGVYYVYFSVPSLKAGYARLPYLVLKAGDEKGG